MIPPQFDYVRPGSLEEVLAILRERAGDAKVLSGGFSLLPLLKLRLAQPELLVDLGNVPGLETITETDGELRIGGRATHRNILESPATVNHWMVREAAAGIGDPQIRNWGTIGGSVAHADPSADWPAVLLATRATIVVRSADGERTLPARGFFVDAFETQIEPDEVLTEIRIPLAPPGSAGTYEKLERRAGDFSTVGVGVRLTVAGGTIARAGIGITAVAPCAFAAEEAEAALVGRAPTEAVLRTAAQAAAAQSQPVSDSHGPADYKRAMVSEMTMRALRRAAERAAANA
ncbi:MAG: aerobic carbon-monoxide dehydrogenase medium subunit [Chloroflexota bacterium]|jgi:carbon-monoxide dehydrogenase medium subunit|nr:aerobic carbon-monoxide dehydrogenase medium subunit [Chloroflexota bacterium]